MAELPAPGVRRQDGPPSSTGHPPNKRARGFPAAAAPDPEDPFGALGDLTADDLEELDTLASQALSQGPPAAHIRKIPRVDGLSRNPAWRNRESVPATDNFELELLQAQYKELKEKMKAMEEEVLIKNGEIKILRDSLHQTESILEEQRRSHFLLEQEKTQALSDREKEFSKKLQSLQSELQFKDAEMNELRTKLQSSERTNKPAVPSVSHVSPRKSPTVIIKPNASSPVFGKTLFPTKESFTANMSLPPPCQTEPGDKSLVGKAESKTHNVEVDLVNQEETQESAVDIWVRKPKAPGCILISLLLKQPLIPESPFSLCDLLSSCSETLTGALQSPGLSSPLTGVSGLRAAGSCDSSFSLSALKEAQNLALTGLNLVARDRDSCDGDPADGGGRAFPLCQLPGAVHLLPLVQFFIGLHCRALQDLATTAKRSGAPGDSAAHVSCVNPGAEANPEDPLCSLEGLSAASLGLLQHLVCHSGAVVCQLLSGAEGASAVSGGGPRPANRRGRGGVPLAPEGLASDQGQHPLLKMLLHLVTFSSVATGYLQTSVLSQCLKVLVKLAENASFDFLPRYNSAGGRLLSGRDLTC